MTQSADDIGRAVIAKAINRHGGDAAFFGIDDISIRMNRFGGAIPLAKGLNRTFHFPDRIVIRPNSNTAVFKYDDGDIIFDNGAIATATSCKQRYRETFNGIRKLRFWTNSDAVYFFGYALLSYFSLPFSLKSLKIRRAFSSGNGVSWVEMIFPDGSDVHSRIQRFWFDDSGLLFRHDYRADIIGPIFYGAHFSHDYRFDLPIPIAQQRLVKLRIGKQSTPISVLNARLVVEHVE